MIDVQAIALGLDHRARPRVQERMRAIAEAGETKSKEGLARMLREAIDVLLAEQASITHAHAEGGPLRADEEARLHFMEVAHRARSRFDVELIRNADGTIIRAAPPRFPPSDEPGVVVVTVVVAARREIADLRDVHDRAALRAALEALRAIEPEELVAIEVIWSPADERDRVPLEELARKHPELRSVG
jgi:uncharacterized membrane protein